MEIKNKVGLGPIITLFAILFLVLVLRVVLLIHCVCLMCMLRFVDRILRKLIIHNEEDIQKEVKKVALIVVFLLNTHTVCMI